ncbi:glycosyltransferase family 2 protein [Roseovarius sp. MMSF_3281]|uniref:glycosyltransferase family 2 protein n=1 Tax=Roseovarius sp. MMSF_3281 TaxID=3046694 RepID=UPI00273F2F1B|nr:glycosyltransferase family 2 protein [Roseovarius sp. MMSF_3281]
MSKPLASVIIPAHDEAGYIGTCLRALLASTPGTYRAEVVVVANACTDSTVLVAQGFAESARARGWGFAVIDTETPGKLNALNLGEARAKGDILVYLDADVIVSRPLLGQLAEALKGPAPLYASGSPEVAPAQSGFTRAYARIWQRLPFVTTGVPGFGVFAMNMAGRARWGAWPEIISDDTFARLNFAPEERERVSARYSWPMIEGFRNLVKVRRRQDDGVEQIAARYPQLLQNDDVTPPSKGDVLRLGLSDPVGLAAYLAVKLAVKTGFADNKQAWARGR